MRFIMMTYFTAALSATVDVDFGYDQVEACPGDAIRVTWTGYHNIRETDGLTCDTNGASAVEVFHSSGHVETYSDLFAQPGQTRYFICTLHCNVEPGNARFEVSCPASPPRSPPPIPPAQIASPPPYPAPPPYPSPPLPPPEPNTTPVQDIVCIDSNARVMAANGSFVPLAAVNVGSQLQTAAGRATTVAKKIKQWSYDFPYLVEGKCNATFPIILSPSHAILCDGKWTTAEEVGYRAQRKKYVEYVNIQTDNYCTDTLILENNMRVETWDGKVQGAWRSHYYEDGYRMNCTAGD